jgi:type II secretory pathway pseudopilin PulG
MNLFSAKNRHRRASAFTIIELLVALTITAAITTFMVTIVVNVLNSWSRSTATLTAGNQARVIMDQLSADIQGAVLRSSSDVMFAATIPVDQSVALNAGRGDANVTDAKWNVTDVKPGEAAGSLVLNPADRDLETYRFGQAGVWLRLFVVPTDNSSATLSDLSAPRAVSYQIVRKQVGSATAPYTYQLFRSEVRPFGTNASTTANSTFSIGYDLFGTNGFNNPAVGGTAAADAGIIRRPRAEYVLGDGVVDFGVRIFTRNAAGILEEAFPFDRRAATAPAAQKRVFAATTDATKTQPPVALPLGNFNQGATSYGYPAVVEVMVRILTPDGIEIIQAYEDDPTRFGGAGKWWELAEANSKVFTRRIEVRTTAL